MTGDLQTAPSTSLSADSDTMVCYCYGLTASALREKRIEVDSLKTLQSCTKAGTGCGGCRVVLQAMFEEEIIDINAPSLTPHVGSTCVKPGAKIMTSFLVADGQLESRIYSCNAVAPQLGNCDTTTRFDYAILNHRAEVLTYKEFSLRTDETFVFDTRDYNLPRPFYGTFVMGMGRDNYGASRFNVQWGNASSVTSTHEISVTGRPKVFLPVFIDKYSINNGSDIHLGILNPRSQPVKFSLVVFNPDNENRLRFDTELGPYHSSWINATEFLYRAALDKWPNDRFVIKVDTTELGHEDAVSVYFFFRNHRTNQWSAQHL